MRELVPEAESSALLLCWRRCSCFFWRLAYRRAVSRRGPVGFTLPEPGLGRNTGVLTDPLVQSVFVRTLRICVIGDGPRASVARLCHRLCLGAGLRRASGMLAEFCILVPFWISVLTRAFGWVALLSNRGLINTWLQAAGVIAEPLTLVRNELGVIIGMTHFLIPFAVFPLASAMRSLDERVLLAARGLAPRALRIFWTVFVPMTGGRHHRRGPDCLRLLARLLRHARHPRRRAQA